ncbi:MAG: Fic family protein [Desulfamplus sp.]|nr:Fic family protein [Desulfamplus sp.]MBF0390545.1 Fic family protein [Desulfamplus sp.]
MEDELKNLLVKIDSLKKILDSARPLINESILNAVDIEYTYDSNRIEGNTLTLRETDIVINKGLTIGGKSMREHLEANNHYEAILYIRDLIKHDTKISESLIKSIHSIVLQGIDRENGGKYRTLPVAISGSRYIPPQPWQVPKMMEDMILWIEDKSDSLHPAVLSAQIHEQIATIHPFIDGNGRTARLVMNLVLLQNGYPISNIPSDTKNRVAYYNALEKCNINSDKSDFLLLIASYVHQSLEKILKILGKS